MNLGFVMPLHNSSKTIKFPFKNFSAILQNIKDDLKVNSFLIFIDDKSNDEEFNITKDFILENLKSFKNNILFLRNTKNLGVFPNLNKAINILLQNDYIKPVEKIDYVIMRDSDDYITTETINMVKELKETGNLAIPRVKIDVFTKEVEEFFLISDGNKTLDEINKSEKEYFSIKCPQYNRERLFFGNSNDMPELRKTILINNISHYEFEFYDLFFAYALAGFNLDFFKFFGGFEIQNLDASARKACDIGIMKILSILLSNLLIKVDNIPFFDKTNENYKSIEKIVKSLKFSSTIKQTKTFDANNIAHVTNAFDYPSIFRVSNQGSLSSANIAKREFFYFQNLDKFINMKRDVYDILKIIKSFQSICNKNNYAEILKNAEIFTNYILQKFYVPLTCENCQEIIYKGLNWIL